MAHTILIVLAPPLAGLGFTFLEGGFMLVLGDDRWDLWVTGWEGHFTGN